MDKTIILLFQKFVDNQCTPQELEQVRDLIAGGVYEKEWDAVLNAEAEKEIADHAPVPNFDASGVLNRINNTITPTRKLRRTMCAVSAAAAVLLMVGLGYLFLKPHPEPAVPALQQLTLNTNGGEQKKITLTDGTEVILNGKSKLRYTDGFAANKREVYLDGEAFFNVTHDATRPFFVHTSKLRVQVLGTSFNVRAYGTDKRSAVSVASGKVGVIGVASHKVFMLLPGQRVACNHKGAFKRDSVAVDDILGWQKGVLSFKQETMQDIAPVLERYYNVNIKISNHRVSEKQITANFNRKTLPQVLAILSQTAGFKYSMSNTEIHIH